MKAKNKYSFPVDKNKTERISYDESRAHRIYKNAVDFIVPEGTPIKAAANGIVVDIKCDSSIGGPSKKFEKHGNFIEIKHTNNEYSEYEHLRKNGVVVELGDKVKRGQIIGYSGATGWLGRLGPHLHFMVGKYGKTVKDYETLEIVWSRE